MRKRTLRRLVALIMVVFACPIAWFFLPRERLLLDYAHRVANTTLWGIHDPRFNNSIGRHWLSDKEVLFDRYEGPQHEQRVVFKRDIETGQETKLDGLTAGWRQLGVGKISSQCVSPDGKWFMCSSRGNTSLLVEVNGTRHYVYPYEKKNDDYHRDFWLPDSRHWLERYRIRSEIYHLILHDTQHPNASVKVPVEVNSTVERMQMVVVPDAAIVVTWPDEATNDFGEILIKADSPPTKQIIISLVPWRTGGKPFARYSFVVPFGLAKYDLHISPDAKHVGWQVTALRPAPLQEWLHHYLPFVAAVQYKTTTVWVSNIDGSNRRELGHILETASPSDAKDIQRDSLLEDLKWLPGGKHLSFEYKNALYVVPID